MTNDFLNLIITFQKINNILKMIQNGKDNSFLEKGKTVTVRNHLKRYCFKIRWNEINTGISSFKWPLLTTILSKWTQVFILQNIYGHDPIHSILTLHYSLRRSQLTAQPRTPANSIHVPLINMVTSITIQSWTIW